MKIRIPKHGYIGPFRLRDIPIHIHWTFPAGGVIVALMLGNVMWKTAIPLVAAYTILVVIHELGHAFAARIVSARVHAVLVTAVGGWCFADELHTFRSRLAFYAGGILAQVLALIVTAFLVALFGNPNSLVLNCFVLVFTIVNVILIVINLLPTEGTDGRKLWDLLKERLGAGN